MAGSIISGLSTNQILILALLTIIFIIAWIAKVIDVEFNNDKLCRLLLIIVMILSIIFFVLLSILIL